MAEAFMWQSSLCQISAVPLLERWLLQHICLEAVCHQRCSALEET